MTNQPLKADLHVHSKYSHRPTSWILKKLGCSESYTEPVFLYKTLKQRGMDLVTITDHNSISGCLEIAHLKDTFISEEVTTYFPEDHCKLHVLAYNITPGQHEDISKIRQNVFDLVPYLNAQNIIHAIAHPMFSINGRLREVHFEKLLLLFKIFEFNGARDTLQNKILKHIIDQLTEEKINRLSEKHNITPSFESPWEKHFISGSDDHSSLYMGYSHTECTSLPSPEYFLADVRKGKTRIMTFNSTPETLAHNIYSIMYQFYDKNWDISKWVNEPDLSDFFNDTLLRSYRQIFSEKGKPEERQKEKKPSITNLLLPDLFLEKAKEIIFSNAGEDTGKPDSVWGNFVRKSTEIMIRDFVKDILNHLGKGDLFHLVTTLSSSASLYMLLSPYFISYSLFSRDRDFSFRCLKKYATPLKEVATPSKYIAMFTDTYVEINGVASAIRSQVKAAGATGKPLKLITCQQGIRHDPNVVPFEPIETFDVPEYPELKLYLPQFLEILSYCYKEQFTHIQAETPGVMGLIALAVSRLFNLPFTGTYHTSLPQTVKALTGDSKIESYFWKYVIWFYGQMEKIYVPSAVTARELIDRGLPEEKIIVHQWGVDICDFHPKKRNGFFSGQYHICDREIKLLYVGRVSQEKNLGIFDRMMQTIEQAHEDIRLIIVGEGPYLPELKKQLSGRNVTFTGYLTGENLSQAYASSDIFLFPSTVDTMGNVVVEAQASGLPVIVTDKGGPMENMVDEHTGLVVHADNNIADYFADAILKLLKNREDLEKMKRNARTYAMTRSFEESFLSFWES